MTEPAGTVVLDAVVIVPTVTPADVIALVAADCVSDTTLGTVTSGGGVPAAATSTTAKFQRSVVGAVTPIVTMVPALSIFAAVTCVQNVSPTLVSTHWCTVVWPERSVRPMALSQSDPTPKMSADGLVVVRATDGAPVDALCFAEAPTTLVLTKVMTVSDWSNPVCVGVLVTVTLVSGAVAVARQTSAVPSWVLARCTSVQVRPAPETVIVCPPEI